MSVYLVTVKGIKFIGVRKDEQELSAAVWML